MGNNWPTTCLDRHISIKHGFAFKGEFFKDSPTPDCLLTPGNFSIGGGFKGDKYKYYDGPVSSDYVLKFGDLVVTMTDLSKQADTLGYSALIPEQPGKRFLHNQRTGLVQFKDDKLDKVFLYFLLRTNEYRHHVVSGATGTTVKHTSPTKILSYEFRIPPKSLQVAIGNHLLSVEKKITLNHQVNQTQEQMAQTLFKSWFVNFDPVVDNALDAGFFEQGLELPDELLRRTEARKAVRESGDFKSLPDAIRRLFPAAFEECSEPSIGLGGWVPQGWRHGCVADVARYSSKRIDTVELMLENYISTENMLTDRKGIQPAATLPTVNSVPAYTSGSVLVSNIRPYFKKIWLANGDGGHSNDVLGFEVKDSDTEGYLYNLMYQDSFFDFMMATSKGSKMPRGDKKAILEWGIVVPPLILRRFFTAHVSKFYASANIRHGENITLTQLRDTLLPKLISGELCLDEVEAGVAEEGAA